MVRVVIVMMVVMFGVMCTRSVEVLEAIADAPDPADNQRGRDQLQEAPEHSTAARHAAATV